MEHDPSINDLAPDPTQRKRARIHIRLLIASFSMLFLCALLVIFSQRIVALLGPEDPEFTYVLLHNIAFFLGIIAALMYAVVRIVMIVQRRKT